MAKLVITRPFDTLPDLNWRWRDRLGNAHYPHEMETRHLFHTLKMVWNNFMPAHQRVGSVKLYRFGSAYTEDYLRDAVMQIGSELFRRELTAYQRQILEEMAAWLQPTDPMSSQSAKLPSTSA